MSEKHTQPIAHKAPRTFKGDVRRAKETLSSTRGAVALLGSLALVAGFANHELHENAEAHNRNEALTELFSSKQAIQENYDEETGAVMFTYGGETVEIPIGSVHAGQGDTIYALAGEAVQDENSALSFDQTKDAFKAQNGDTTVIHPSDQFLFPVEPNQDQ